MFPRETCYGWRDRHCGSPDTVPSWPEAQTQSLLRELTTLKSRGGDSYQNIPLVALIPRNPILRVL